MAIEWWKKATVYQIYPRSFCDSNADGIGDLPGVTSKLGYLKELGVEILWLSPYFKSPMRDNGYDISDYREINSEFGTMDDFDELLKQAHTLGIKIMMDLVVNHTSDEHPWFIESRSDRENPKRDYYIWRDGKDGGPPNDWKACFGGSAWSLDETTGQYFFHFFSPFQPDLNWDNPRVRGEVYDLMRFWLNKGIDGFRLDAINLIAKPGEFTDEDIKKILFNGKHIHEYLKEMRHDALSHFDAITVGEASGATVEDALLYANMDRTELDMIFQFEHVELDAGDPFKWNDKKINLVELKEVLSRWQKKLFTRAWNSLYWCNHDQPRIVSRLGNEGEYREKSAKMLAICLHFMQGTPYVYQGEELGMTNAPFKDISEVRDYESINAYKILVSDEKKTSEEDMMRYIRLKGRDNARTPMHWHVGKYAGFSEKEPWIMLNPNYIEINAEEQISRADSVFACYKTLIKMRKNMDILTLGNYELLLPDDGDLFVYTRRYNIEELYIACNYSKKEKELTVPDNFHGSKLLLSNEAAPIWKSSTSKLTLGPFGAAVLKLH